jgi:hypothetical protein
VGREPLLLLMRVLMLLLARRVGGVVMVHCPVPWRGTIGRITLSAMMTLLMKSGNDPLVSSAMRSYSLVERPIMKRSFFLSSVSTWFSTYCARWLNSFK